MLQSAAEAASTSQLETELLELDLNNVTPLEALQLLTVWQQKAGAREDDRDGSN